jgi:hypothetical protein
MSKYYSFFEKIHSGYTKHAPTSASCISRVIQRKIQLLGWRETFPTIKLDYENVFS